MIIWKACVAVSAVIGLIAILMMAAAVVVAVFYGIKDFITRKEGREGGEQDAN